MNNNRIFTIPNFMTLMRLLFLIPILWCLAHQLRWWALFWTSMGILTDLLDGWVARKFNQASDLGRLMDPMVDKINGIVVTFYMAISPYYDFPLWYFIFFTVRELCVLAGGWAIVQKRQVVPESNTLGKRSAFVTGLMVLLFMIDWQPYAWILLWLSLALTLLSTVGYIRVYVQNMKRL